MSISRFLLCGAAALVLGGGSLSAAEGKTVTGTISEVSATSLHLTVEHEKDKPTFALTESTPITVDGEKAKAKALHKGMEVSVTTDAAGAVTAVVAEEHKKKKKKA